MNSKLKILVLAGLLLSLAAPPAMAGTYKDKKRGFTIKLVSNWSQTPTQPGEQTEVAKFKDDRKGAFATLSIYRFAKVVEEVTTPASGDGETEIPREIPRLPAGFGLPDNAKEYLETLVGRTLDRLKQIAERRDIDAEIPDFPEPRKLKYGKVEGELYIINVEPIRKLYFQGSFTMAGIVGNETEEYLILYSCAPNRAKKLQRTFVGSIKSFRLPGDETIKAGKHDDDDPEGRFIGDPDKPIIDPEKRARIKAELVGTWRFIDTNHYIVIYNCDRPLAAFIAKRIEFMRQHAYEKVFPPLKPIEECMVVRVTKEMDEYHHYGGPRGSAGYWASSKDELVFPDLSNSKKPDKKTIGVLHHEGFHQFIYYSLLKNNPPVWFNEGCAEYFFCVNERSTSKRLVFDKRHEMRYGTVKTAVSTGAFFPIEDFVKLSHGQYMAKAQLCYSQGWAFITWMKNVTRNERYREIPNIYFNELQRGYAELAGKNDPMARFRGRNNEVTKRALEKAFEGIDYEKVNKAFLADVKRRM